MKHSIIIGKYSDQNKKRFFSIALAVIILVLLFLLVYVNMIKDGPASSKLERGILNLSSWDADNEKILQLSGEWEFYWQQQLYKQDFNGIQTPTYVQVPHLWNNYIDDAQQPLSPYGYATYRLQIQNAPLDQALAVKIGKTSIVYRIYVDEMLILENANAANTPLIATFQAPAPQFDLIIHVSNDDYSFGGMWYSTQIGTEQNVRFIHTMIVQKESILLGILFIMALYYLSFYIVIRKDRLNLLFVIGCMLIMLRVSLYGERTVYLLFPQLSYDTLLILAHLADVWSALPFMILIYYLFPQESWRLPLRIYFTFASVYSILLFFVPVNVVIMMSNVMIVVATFTIGASCITVIRAVYHKRNGAFPHLIGFISMAVLAIHDMLYAQSLVPNQFGELGSVGVTILLATQAFVLAQRYFQAFREAEKLSQDLVVLNRQKDDFLASTSYELKAPLNGIIGLSKSMKEGITGVLNDQQRHNLDLIISSGRKLNHLLDDLLVYSRMKYEKITLQPTHVRLDGILQPITQFHRHLISEKPIRLVTEIPQDIAVYADENRLIQILHNVVGNAVYYTEQGTITVSVRKNEEGWIEITVQDTGMGIPMEEQQLMYASFEEIDRSLVEYGGISLGLPIAKYLIELHGGHMSVDSRPPAGSIIRFTLPEGEVQHEDFSVVMQEIAAHTSEAILSNDLLHIHGHRQEVVLVVDDDVTYLQAIINFLSLDGYSIVATTDSEKAWRIIEEKRNQLSLVILDVMLPKLSGYQLCSLIREHWTEIEMPVLMMTAVYKQEAMLAGFEVGTNDYLTKPFEPEEFRARVRTLLQIKSTMTKVKEVELAFLQAQIKPHFLFNTLNTIATFCMKNPRQARDLIGDLATYLRHSFDFHRFDQLVTIETEMELVEAYLNIEQARFRERLQVKYHINAAMKQVLIPQLTIQPLVENAVRHGVMKKSDGGTIHIEITNMGAACKVCVSDDGVGMTEERVRRLFSAEHGLGRERTGIGLRNIDARLRKLFGSGLSFATDQGTAVSFLIPMHDEGHPLLQGESV